MEVPSEKQGVPAPHWAPQPEAQVLGRGVTITSGCENQQGLHPRKTAQDQGTSLKGKAHRLTCLQTYSKLWRKGSSLKSSRNIYGEGLN